MCVSRSSTLAAPPSAHHQAFPIYLRKAEGNQNNNRNKSNVKMYKK